MKSYIKTKFKLFSFGLFMLSIVSGCMVGPNYISPSPKIPENWKWSADQMTPHSCSELEEWWEIFKDPTLNILEEQAITANQELLSSLGRLFEARAKARLNASPLYPQIALNASDTQAGLLFQNYIGVGPDTFRIQQSQYTIPFDFNYEIDLWGKLRRQYASARAHAEASEEDLYVVLLSITSDIARNYFQLRALDEEDKILQATIAQRKEQLDIQQIRYKAGLINRIDVSRAEVELANSQADQIDITRRRELLENIIALLSGQIASEFCLEKNPLNEMAPEIPSGMPCELLKRRPDIAEAERILAAQNEQVGVAIAAFFPSFNLTGALGLSSPLQKDLFEWQARYWSWGINLSQTIFDGGSNQANLKIAKAQYLQALAAYQEQVLIAFREVEDALASLILYKQEMTARIQAVEAAKETVQLSLERYKKGLVFYLDVVDAERTLLEAQRSVTQLLGQQYISTVTLIQALGGDWTCKIDDDKGYLEIEN